MVYALSDKIPKLHPDVYTAPGAQIIGDVQIEAGSTVWFNSVLRGDVYYIRVGRNTNIQDNCVIHVTSGKHPTLLENDVTVAHHAVIHGATLKDHAFVGISATVMDRAVVHPYGFVAAGALVPPGFEVPEKTLVAGVPAKIIRSLKSEEIDMIHRIGKSYVELGKEYKSNLKLIHK